MKANGFESVTVTLCWTSNGKKSIISLMKKYAVIFGLVFMALVFASCALKGGTIEVINNSAYTASIAVYKGLVQVTALETAAPGKKVIFSIDEDGSYTINAIFSSNPIGHGSGEAVLLGGNKVTVNVKPTN